MNRLLNNLRHNMGPLINAALDDPDVVEIMANPDGTLWVERFGDMQQVGLMDAMNAQIIVSLVADSLNMTATALTPIIEGELPGDGSRFEGLMPPVVSQPSFTIRKKASRIYPLVEYLDAGILPPPVYEAILDAIQCRKNILVVGGTGSGKTTLVNGIIGAIADLCPHDRLTVIEDTAELQPINENRVVLRSTATVTVQQLVRATMRLRPDRIIVGEVRDGTALDLLKAWNTGHPGGVATVHANSAPESLIRLEDLIGEVSVRPMQGLIGSAVDVVIFIRRVPLQVGRRITQAARVSGFEPLTQSYTLEYIHNEELPLVA